MRLSKVLPLLLALCAAPAWAEDVVRDTLPNGLRVVIVPDRLAPVVSTNLNYLAGSNDAPDGFPGTAHALEHMMFRGSAALDRDQLAELGARLGGSNNASTTETVTQYVYDVPADSLDLVLRIEAGRMRGLSLLQQDWEKERGAIEQEVSRDLSSPFYKFGADAQAVLFKGTPYEHDALGTRPSFDRTDAAMLRQFYETWYAPNNAILVIAGDVQPQQALAQVRAAFGDIPAHPVPAHPTVRPQPADSATLTLPTDFPVGVVALAFRMPGLKDADFAAADILADVLNSERGALFALVPGGKALLAQFGYQAKPDVGFGMAIGAFPTGGDPQPLLADLRRVLADAANGAIPPALVEASKHRELAQLAFSADSIDGLAQSWSHALASRGGTSPDELAAAYGAVTVADVARVARAVLDQNHMLTAILTPRGAGGAAEGKGYGGGESLSAPPDHPVTLPGWAAAALATPTLPPDSEPPVETRLPNGLRLIVQPEHVGHSVSVFGRIRQVPDMQEPPGKEGLAQLTAALFNHGTQKRDRLAFAEAADAIAADIDAGSGFSLRVVAPDIEQGLALLAEGELQPAFGAEDFTVLRQQLADTVAGQLQSPDYLFDRATKAALVPPADPTLRQATPASLMGLQPDDVTAFHAAAYRPDLTTIVVVGDIAPERARALVERNFGGWQASGPTPVIDLPPVPPSHGNAARVADASVVQETMWLGQSLALPVGNPDRYPLVLGNMLLGEGFSSRLYRDLRVHSGYVYAVDSGIDWRRTRSTFEISFGADRENVDKARDLALRDVRDLQSAPVSEAELDRAKAGLLRQLSMRQSSVGAIAQRLLYVNELGLPLVPVRETAARFLAVTAPDIQRAMAAWLRPDDLAQVAKGPPQ